MLGKHTSTPREVGDRLSHIAYLRSVKQVDSPLKDGTFLPPLLYGSDDMLARLEQVLPPKAHTTIAGLQGSSVA